MMIKFYKILFIDKPQTHGYYRGSVVQMQFPDRDLYLPYLRLYKRAKKIPRIFEL